MRSKISAVMLSLLLPSAIAMAQQPTEQQRGRRTAPAQTPQPTTPPATEPEPSTRARQTEQEQQPARERTEQPQERPQMPGAGGATSTTFHFDMKETSPNVTH